MVKRKRETTYKPRKARRVMRKKAFKRRPIPRGPFPVSKVAKLRLATNEIIISSVSGGLAGHDVYANWPYYGTRHAFGWDQWVALYNQATCIGSKITIYHHGTGTASATPFLIGIYLADDTTTYTDYRTMIENRRGRFMRCSNNITSFQPRQTHTFSAKKFFNVKDVKDNVDHLGASTSSVAPANEALYKLWMQPVDKSSSTSCTLTAVIEYIMVFAEPKDPVAS